MSSTTAPSLLASLSAVGAGRRGVRSIAAVVAAAFIVLVAVAAVLATWIAPWDPNAVDLANQSQAPSLTTGHLLGTDALGRDVLSRVIHGSRPPLTIALLSVLLGLILGLTLGVVAGYFRGAWDHVLGRLTDVQLSIPQLVLALVFLAIYGSSAVNVILIIAIGSWPLYFRVVRTQVLTIRRAGFIEAAEFTGRGTLWIVLRHVLPNTYPVLLVTATINFNAALLAESSLSYLGVGIQPPTADWGLSIAEGQTLLASAWWISLAPGIVLVALLLSLQVLSDHLVERFALKDAQFTEVRQ